MNIILKKVTGIAQTVFGENGLGAQNDAGNVDKSLEYLSPQDEKLYTIIEIILIAILVVIIIMLVWCCLQGIEEDDEDESEEEEENQQGEPGIDFRTRFETLRTNIVKRTIVSLF